MGKVKEKTKLKNPSFCKKESKPGDDLTKTILELQQNLRREKAEHEKIREKWLKHYSHLCLFFLGAGCIVGVIVGAILL